jgi:hypothetical protein
MKKLLIAIILAAVASTSFAGGRGHGHGGHHGHHGGHGWILPALVTGAVVYAVTRPAPVYAAPAPQVVYTPAPQVVYAAPALCTETLPPPPPGYAYRSVYDPALGCYRNVLHHHSQF